MPLYSFETRSEVPTTIEELRERIKAFHKIRDEIDRELGMLLGHQVEIGHRQGYHCVRCDHRWFSRLATKPRMCPKCKAVHFERPPKWRWVDRNKKEELLQAPLPHSVLTRQDAVEEVTLTPPPALSLRERLALTSTQNPPPEQRIFTPQQPVIVEDTEAELVESINESDAT
jgi:hypothetical protein